MKKTFLSLGLMSGTSGDGVDVALLKTDGYNFLQPLDAQVFSYPKGLADKLQTFLQKKQNHLLHNNIVNQLSDDITNFHIKCVEDFFNKYTDSDIRSLDLIGFHGQTIYHNPTEKITLQIGCGETIAKHFGITTIGNFRQNDIDNGGQGAPIAPVFHKAISVNLTKPLVILNIGGVSNITYISKNDLIACDVGTGVALINDWIKQKTTFNFDEDGKYGLKGNVNQKIIDLFLNDSYFKILPPKSLDRNHFSYIMPYLKDLSLEDGSATLAACSAIGVKKNLEFFPKNPSKIYVAGGGRLNLAIIDFLKKYLDIEVFLIDNIGWSGDFIEAYMMSYLAVRSYLNLDITFPKTTGVKKAISGGIKFLP
jgi:anhydro-N-acetylmuramic acid kinase